MNWKQLICMWCGIAAICGLGWLGLYVEHFAYMGYKGFFFRAFFVRGKQNKFPEKSQITVNLMSDTE